MRSLPATNDPVLVTVPEPPPDEGEIIPPDTGVVGGIVV